MICDCTDTSSEETGSSRIDQLRLAGERTGDADALSLAARELVRVAIGESRAEADQVEQLLDSPSTGPAAPVEAMDLQRLTNARAHRTSGVERGVRVLEDHRGLGPQAPEARPAELDILAVEPDTPARRPFQAQQREPDGGLAAARLADQAQRLTLLDGEGHAIDGADLATADREQDLEAGGLHQWPAHDGPACSSGCGIE